MTAPPLAIEHRRHLERAVNRARVVAEDGATAALIALDYDGFTESWAPPKEGKPPVGGFLGQLAYRAYQLGEEDMTRGQRLLIEEIAYERWHRMLFSAFLAANDLLRTEGATVTLDDCAEIADERGDGSDRWSVAVGFAEGLLPGIFKPNIPATKVRLAREYLDELEAIVVALPGDVYTSADGLGWVYQFWQARRKKEINDRVRSTGEKITGAEIPPVTQLFTDDYIVRFMLENTLGAWWAGKRPDSPLLAEMPYLRWAETTGEEQTPPQPLPGPVSRSEASAERSDPGAGEGLGEGSATDERRTRTPAAGTFPGWAEKAKDLKILDPCAGSGHFLVAAFELLRRMRMEEDGLSDADAADAVLRDNLAGLELDRRCTQVAMFNLSLAAWKVGGHPEIKDNWPRIVWSGTHTKNDPLWDDLRVNATPSEIFLLDDIESVMRTAPTLGSLIQPKRIAELSDYPLFPRDQERSEYLATALVERLAEGDDRHLQRDAVVEAAMAYDMLRRRYDLTITNVPYLSRGSHNDDLRRFADEWHPNSKSDLATMMLERAIRFGEPGGTAAAVTPQNWLFLGSYRKLRQDLLVTTTLNTVARLGSGAFETVTGEVVNVSVVAVTAGGPPSNAVFAGIDVSTQGSVGEKTQRLLSLPALLLSQGDQYENPDSRITLDENSGSTLLLKYADSFQGISPADYPRYGRNFWEIENPNGPDWRYHLTTVETTRLYGGRECCFRWESPRPSLFDQAGAYIRGQQAWGRNGVQVSSMGRMAAALSTGELSDTNVALLVPRNPNHLSAIWAYCSSPYYHLAVRRIDQKMNVTNATLVKVPFDLDHWTKVAAEQYPDGLPEPHSDDPTQWLFTGHPRGSDHPLHVALARLLGYRWPDQPADDHGLGRLADPDGIVCLPAVSGEPPAHARLRELLRAAWATSGEETDWQTDTVDTLLAGAGSAGRTLETWLLEDAFKQHCALFHNRPFLWHVWDGRKDGFSAFVNYHRLDGALLDKLTYTYLGDWIGRQREDAERNVAGARARLDAALDLQGRLELIRRGEAPHDIYVRWKPLHRQPIGWAPDLDDGVRLNVRPFVEAGVLRAKFTVHWRKDRGANPEGSDVHRWSADAQAHAYVPEAEISGKARLNDLHLTLVAKRAARDAERADAAGDGD